MTSVMALVAVAMIAFMVIRIGAHALEMTGLSRDASRFQALSAFFGAGFTTGESELVVRHPVRRRIIRDLIVIGNIGVMTLIATVVVTFVNEDSRDSWERAAWIAGLLLAFAVVARTKLISALVDRSIRYTLERTRSVRAIDYEELLRLKSGYVVSDLTAEEGHWVDGRSLGEMALRKEGVNVLGVVKARGEYIAMPHGETTIGRGDTLIVYGREGAIRELAERPAGAVGDEAHEKARRRAEPVRGSAVDSERDAD